MAGWYGVWGRQEEVWQWSLCGQAAVPSRRGTGLFQCGSGPCLPHSMLCDGEVQCPLTWDDEDNCRKSDVCLLKRSHARRPPLTVSART
ncbi:putative Low-density lipoprotein receptor domain class A-containing protein 1 [Homarus americanus]|uniref:Putative Low-density lipoprotein receptor domain class A-containing protein 1 n=1 Tax=Homarus americanus TaxID=6706 RepID=A0A8J5MKD8_HOMAM|nr:putative Low-density lipoprotein receptor domain class A-containing protein 1 [Homarus americanus]